MNRPGPGDDFEEGPQEKARYFFFFLLHRRLFLGGFGVWRLRLHRVRMLLEQVLHRVRIDGFGVSPSRRVIRIAQEVKQPADQQRPYAIVAIRIASDRFEELGMLGRPQFFATVLVVNQRRPVFRVVDDVPGVEPKSLPRSLPASGGGRS